MRHAFTFRAADVTFCRQCGRTDMPEIRRRPCVPRADVEAILKRRLKWVEVAHDIVNVGRRAGRHRWNRRKKK